MGMIQKRADELKPGDVIAPNAAYAERIVVAVSPSENHVGALCVRTYSNGAAFPNIYDPGVLVDVESPDLTPAQLHAEELLHYAKRALDLDDAMSASLKADERAALQALLDAIKPPEPPTLAEALGLLGDALDSLPIHKQLLSKSIADVLDRARGTKVWP